VAGQVWSTDFLERKDLVDEPALGLLQSSNCCGARVTAQMTPPHMEPSKQPTNTEIKFSKTRLALAFAIAGISDAIGAFATPLPPIVWVVDLATALLLFMVLGRRWLLLPGLALEAIPGLGVLPFWLLVVGAIAVLGTPRPTFERH
jgi:hypothetical protein